MADSDPGQQEEETTVERKLTKTLTFGLGRAYGWAPREKKLVDLTDDQQKAVYRGLRATSRILARMINVLNAREYVRRVMEIPDEVVDQFKPNYTPIKDAFAELGMPEVDDIGGATLSQTYALGVKPDFAGEHGKRLLYIGDRQMSTHRTDGTHPIFGRGKETHLVTVEGRFHLVVQIFSMTWATKNGLASGWVAFAVKAKPRDKTLVGQLEKVQAGDWDLKNSRILRNPRKRGNRWLGQFVVSYTPEPFKPLSPDTVMGIDLGVTLPACVHIRKDGAAEPWAMGVGRGRDMLRARSMIRAQIVRIVRSLRSKDSPLVGEARKVAKEKLRALRKQEKRVMKTASRKVAARIADTARRHGAGVWQMERLDVGDLKEDSPWLTRNWAPGMLIDAVRWQAEQLGVELRFVNPRYTSQRCAQCGFISSANRPKGKKGAAHFECVQCGHSDHADKNAARNLSIEGIESIIAAALDMAPNGAAR